MAEWKTAGKVRMTPKGVHSSNSTYEVLDLVSSSDGLSYYISKKAVPSGIALSNTEYWDAVININTILNGCVSADDVQMFSETQKSTARSNISAASASDIERVISQNTDNGLAGAFPSSEWYSNYRISCGTVGGDVEWVASNGYKCVDYSCSVGDVFIINTSADADEGYCCYAFVDSNSKVIANSGADVVTMSNQRIVAPDDTARLIINGIMSSTDICYIGDYIGTKIQNVDTRVEELEDYIKGMSPSVTLSEQDMAHIEDAAPLAPDTLEFDVVATQDGSGTPSPTNIRPIRVIESVKGHKAGKNLLCGMRRARSQYNGIKFTDPGDGGIHAEGTATANAYSDYTADESVIKNGNYPYLPVGQYVISAPTTAPVNGLARYYVSIWDNNFNQVGSAITIYSDSDLNTRTIILTKPCWIYLRVQVPNGTTIDNTLYPAIYRADDVSEEWVTYSGEEYDITIPSSAGLVYACKVDPVAGKLKVYGASQTFTGSDIEKMQWTRSNGMFRYQRFNYTPDQNSGNQIAIACSHFKCVDNDHNETDMYYYVNRNTDPSTPAAPANYFADSNYTTVNDWCDYLAAQNTAGTPVTVVYRIQTPIEYDISTLDINLFKGLNNVWCDDGKVDLSYRANIVDYVEQDIEKASKNIYDLSDQVGDLKSHVIVNSAVGAMLDVAEGYFKQAYDANTHLVYDETRGLFAPQTTSDETGEEGFPAIVCSQFSQALIMGVKYDQSRYVKPANHISGWGYTSDGTGVYPYTSAEISDLPSQDYMIAKQQLKYAIDHNWSYEITNIRRQVRPGDFIYWGSENVSSWEQIDHVALCLHVGLDDNYIITLESDNLTFGTKRVGVGTKRYAIQKYGGHYAYGVRFPVHPALISPKLILSDKNLSGTNASYAIKQYTLDAEQPSGFYTAIIDGAFVASRVEIGVHYTDTVANTFDYSRGRVVANAGRYAVTFYADRAFDQVRIGASTGNAYTINKFCLFKGYYGQDWNLPV